MIFVIIFIFLVNGVDISLQNASMIQLIYFQKIVFLVLWPPSHCKGSLKLGYNLGSFKFYVLLYLVNTTQWQVLLIFAKLKHRELKLDGA